MERIGCLTLFVTHYHLLCNLTAAFPDQAAPAGVISYAVVARAPLLVPCSASNAADGSQRLTVTWGGGLGGQVGNYHVGFMAGEGDRVTFLYRLVPGSAHRRCRPALRPRAMRSQGQPREVVVG